MALRGGNRWQALTMVAAAGLVLAACGSHQEVLAPELNTTVPAEQAILGPVAVDEPGSLAAVDVDPSTFYVSSTLGADSSDGQTPETPWASLQRALDVVRPGHTLYVMSGTYDELREPGNAHYVLDTSGSADAWIRVVAAPGEQPVIMAGSGNGMSIRGDYVEVSGLTVQGAGFDADNAYGWGLLIRNAHHVRVINNTISAMAVGGITAIESSNIEILHNEVFDNSFWGTEQGSGISIWHAVDSGLGPAADGYHDRVVANTVYRNENKVFSRWRDDVDVITDGNGIIIDQTQETGYTGRTLVANNVVFDNGGRGILVLESSRVDVIFNTTYHNGRTDGLEGGSVELAASRVDDVRLYNNLAWSRPGSPALTLNETTNLLMGGNLFVTSNVSGLATALDLVTASDPGLVAPGIDPSLADFRPTKDSLAIGRAIPIVPQLAFDADGGARIPTEADAGAYEFAGGDGLSS